MSDFGLELTIEVSSGRAPVTMLQLPGLSASLSNVKSQIRTVLTTLTVILMLRYTDMSVMQGKVYDQAS